MHSEKVFKRELVSARRITAVELKWTTLPIRNATANAVCASTDVARPAEPYMHWTSGSSPSRLKMVACRARSTAQSVMARSFRLRKASSRRESAQNRVRRGGARPKIRWNCGRDLFETNFLPCRGRRSRGCFIAKTTVNFFKSYAGAHLEESEI
eukprot:5928854-Pleurochrysis_carterae.AAC.1